MTEADIKVALDDAKLRALGLLERWAFETAGQWRVRNTVLGWLVELLSNATGEVRHFSGASQHDAMAQAAQYIEGIL